MHAAHCSEQQMQCLLGLNKWVVIHQRNERLHAQLPLALTNVSCVVQAGIVSRMNEPLTAARRGRGASVCLLNKSLQALALCMICLLLGACAMCIRGSWLLPGSCRSAALACRVAADTRAYSISRNKHLLSFWRSIFRSAETNNYCQLRSQHEHVQFIVD